MENDGDGPLTPTSPFEVPMDLDFMEELFLDGCWVETTDAFDIDFSLPQSDPALDSDDLIIPSNHLPVYQPVFRESRKDMQIGLEELEGTETPIEKSDFQVEGTEGGKRLWIAPKNAESSSSSLISLKQRLTEAIRFLKECTKDRDVLIQIWIPVKKEGRQVLTTDEQPFTVGVSSRVLESYRDVSKAYNFPADGDSKESVGLPGRVFLAKLPEWTPDVRFFRSEEYPRIDHAKHWDVRGSMAVPVFERGSGTCLGVVEMITTSSKINYRPELEIVCKALEAVDLRSSQTFSTPTVKVGSDELYQNDSFLQILEVLKSICKLYRLPLALTWAPCVKQGKEGCRHSNENYIFCVSTIDPACFVSDPEMVGFLEACSEHHLLKGEGIVGRAFSSNQPSFSVDITAFGKSEYPLSHHARIFDLQYGIAIPLTSVFSDSPDFVLEFFLPKECKESEERSQVMNSLLGVVHLAFRNTQFVIGKELKEFVAIEPLNRITRKEEANRDNEDSLGVFDMTETQRKDKEPQEEYANADNCIQGGKNSSVGARQSGSGRRGGERRRTKAESTITLEVLRQYFAGSLKDAAKSLGVCPTTMKRICRQHGITRWPSRKIKKAGHSLKKLQRVIDSVHGAEGSIPLDSFYASFPELGQTSTSGPNDKPPPHSPNPNPKPDHPQAVRSQLEINNGPLSSSSCSRSSTSTASCSKVKVLAEDTGAEVMKRAHSETELNQEVSKSKSKKKPISRSQSHKLINEAPPPPISTNTSLFRVKATFGEEKVRFALQPGWGFRDLQREILRRFGVDDFSTVDLKYLDDDHELVLLTCDADLEECIDVYRSSSEGRTIRISLHQAMKPPDLNRSLGSSGQSLLHDRFL